MTEKTPTSPPQLEPLLQTPPKELLLPDYRKWCVCPSMCEDAGMPYVADAYDGDTVTLIMSLGHDVFLHPAHYRLYGIDAPEIRPLKTRRAGTAARDFLRELIAHHAMPSMTADKPWLESGYWLIARTHTVRRKRDYQKRAARGKFGRFLVELYGADDIGELVSLNRAMLDAGYAMPYLD